MPSFRLCQRRLRAQCRTVVSTSLPHFPFASLAAEEEQGGRRHTDTAQFLQAATKDVYGTTKGGSLEDTVGRRAFFNDRSGAAGYKK